MDVLDLDRPEEATASRVRDSIARLIVRPIVLSGPNGALADLDLMRARREEIEELILWSLQLSVHCVDVVTIEFDWNEESAPLMATTVGGQLLPNDDHRLCALRAAAGEAIMAVCD
jgi:hypothetical protein